MSHAAGTACAKACGTDARRLEHWGLGGRRGVRRDVGEAEGQSTQALMGRVTTHPVCPSRAMIVLPSSPQSFPVGTIRHRVSVIMEHIREFGIFTLRANEGYVSQASSTMLYLE